MDDTAGDNTRLLAPKDELKILLKSIEDSSRHSRSILFAVVTSCTYILLAAFSSSLAENVTLPVLSISVDAGDFLLVSPIVITVLYVYLQIYVSELLRRLRSFDRLIASATFGVGSPYDLTYPWLLVFMRARCNEAEPGGRTMKWVTKEDEAGSTIGNFFVRFVAMLSIWWLAPIAILVLWARFVGQQQAVSLIPCLCLVLALLTVHQLRDTERASRIVLHAVWAFSVCFVLVTVASVPNLRSLIRLGFVWDSWETLTRTVTAVSIHWWGWLIIATLSILLGPSLPWVILRPFGLHSLRARLRYRAWFFSQLDELPDWVIAVFFVPSLLLVAARNRILVGVPSQVADGLLQDMNVSYVNLAGVNFESADLRNADLVDVDLSGANLKGINLEGARLQLAQLAYADLSDANLTRADLSGAILMRATLTRVQFNDTKYSLQTKFPEHFTIGPGLMLTG